MTEMKMNRRRGAWMVLALALGTGLAGCAALAPRSVDVSEAQLAAALAQEFPVRRKVLDVFDVALRDPQLRLMPETQRLGTRLAYTLESPWLGQPQQGTLALSYGLRLEPSDGSVRMTEVRVDSFELPGVPPMLRAQLAPLGSALAETLLQDATLHRFKEKDLARARALGLQPGTLRVTPAGLQMQLAPLAQPVTPAR